jgi:hypothetical protein
MGKGRVCVKTSVELFSKTWDRQYLLVFRKKAFGFKRKTNGAFS